MSFAEQLRAIRINNGHKNGNGSKDVPSLKETECPWKPDIDRVQQTLQEVLYAIARLSGVELPGVTIDSEKPDDSFPQLDCNTLKDRIRKELEGFSINTTAELACQAGEQAQSALEAIQNQMSGRIEQVAAEFREKLQGRLEPEQIEIDISKRSKERVTELVQAQTDEFARWVWLMCKGTETPIPVQIGKLMEPYVDEAAARLEGSFRQKVQDLLAEQEQLFRDRFQGTISSFQAQISTLEQTAQQICEQKADSVAKLSADRLRAAEDDAVKNFEHKLNDDLEGALGLAASRIQSSLNNSLETYRKQLEQTAAVGLEEHRQAITFDITDIHIRLKRAGELLAGLSSESLCCRPV